MLRTVKAFSAQFTDYCYDHKRLVLSLSLFLVAFIWLITRLPYLLYYPLPSVAPDYASYWVPIWEIEQGQMPIFNYRTPGYPLFMAAVLLFSKKLMSIVFAQQIFTLFVSLFTVFSISRIYFLLTPFVAIGMAGFISSYTQVQIDMSLLTESVFSKFLILSLVLIVLALLKKRMIFFLLASACMAFSIYVRPTGQFFIITFLMVLGYLIINKYARKHVFAFASPFLALMLLLPTYNYAKYGRFNVTNGKELTLLCGASFYLEEDPSYSPELNQVITEVRGRFSKEDRDFIENSWNFDKMPSHYYKNVYWHISNILSPFSSVPEAKEIGIHKVYEKVAMNSISKNFPMFLKIYAMNLNLYFFKNITNEYHFYGATLPNAYNLLVLKKDYASVYNDDQRKSLLREFHSPSMNLDYFVKEATTDGFKVTLATTPLQFVHKVYRQLQNLLFRKTFWPVLLLSLCLISLILSFHFRFKHPGAFIMLILTSAGLGHGLISSIFGNTPRFSAPTEFLYYLSAAFIPVLFLPQKVFMEKKTTDV